jgi:predicted transcriptional regulator
MKLPNQLKLRELQLLVRAALHPTNQKILVYLDNKPGTIVTDLYKTLKLEQSVCSQFLAQLRRSDLVTTEREGKNIRYFVNGGTLDALKDILTIV